MPEPQSPNSFDLEELDRNLSDLGDPAIQWLVFGIVSLIITSYIFKVKWFNIEKLVDIKYLSPHANHRECIPRKVIHEVSLIIL